MHTALLVSWRGAAVMIDCGADWAARVSEIHAHAILLTHAHPDHAGGLKAGAPCPVYATGETWKRIRTGPIPERGVVEPRTPMEVLGIRFEAYSRSVAQLHGSKPPPLSASRIL